MHDKMKLKISMAFLWVAIYFVVMMIYTFFDIAIWRKITLKYSNCLNIVFIIACVIAFIILLCNRTGYKVKIFKNVTIINILLAVGCSVLFYFLLDKCFDPIFESLYPASEQAYENTIQSLLKTPITSLLQVCIIAPVIEEILMRGFVLGGLKDSYGNGIALLISAVLFAVLHFNMVQTISAFICGIILGILFLKTDSILSCIIAHIGYNLISFAMMIMPYIKR
ncbi:MULTISPECIES: CPBP family intramembrane glutamic endopeptidase [Clostridium]|uniref:CAAX amino terminal protease self-immunity n=1 Tax=Clostridium ragsdalei P11 TaxID=1353534 RepID=A0A1A6ARM0_9CLOT|nr:MULTISPECIES: type II CAAX endopeptidase family protein [Clostridium]OBR92688.1 CAAX amino terminal protease self- immunity [Clostridium ragsdalei P11]QXE18688.1 CPBP family intramembrane metalloprotease [Clostridium sp. 001]